MIEIRVYDLRARRVPSRPDVRMVSASEPARFAPGGVRGVVLHQTMCVFAPATGTTGEAGVAERALGVRCHALALDGFYVLAAPLDWIVNHGNGFNGEALGLEVEGVYPGLRGRHRAGGPPETVWTRSRLETACEALRRLVTEARAAGHPCDRVWTHRQSNGKRRADPGEEIWRDLGDFAVRELGMRKDPALILPASTPRSSAGRPIPLDWDPAGVGRY